MKIFVVDDDPLSRTIAADALRDPAHEVVELDNGAALMAALDEAPDLVLLDIEMPGTDGITACRALRKAGHDALQVLFVSVHDDLETRLAAYDAGGDDFIVKPFDAQELMRKARIARQNLDRRQALSTQAQVASQTAFTAMSSMGETGVVLNFMRASFACQDMTQLAQALFDALRQYDLSGLLEFRSPAGRQCFSSRDECTPLESSILGHARDMDRIFQFRDRLAINYPSVTLLVLNLPLADPDRIGRLRDHLAALTEGAEAKIQALTSELRRQAQSGGIRNVIADISSALAEIERGQAQNRAQSTQINMEQLRDLNNAFARLGLSDRQEAVAADIAQHAHDRIIALIDDDHSIGDRMRAAIGRLQALAGA